MERKLSRHISVWVLILFLLSCSCNLPLLGKTPATMPALGEPTPMSSEAPALPLSFFDLYQENVQSGTWTEGQGLVKMLGYFNGEVPAAQVFGDRQVRLDSPTAVMVVAQQYLTVHPDAPEKAEIERLMNMLIPDTEKLLPYSEEMKDTSMSASKLAAPVSGPQEDEVACNELWSGGFPVPSSGNPPICFDYLSFTVQGLRFRIFMERSWLQNNINLRNKFLELTKKALTASVETYAPLGHSGLLPSDVVFNQLIYGAGTSEASSYSLMATKPWFLNKCPIGIFPGALTQPDAFFEQEVAHEMFHCFQGKNIFTWLNGRYSEQKWWLEGTAEYFANVVYPDANEEHTRTGDVDARTPTTSLFHMDYDNFLFFQHMGNEFSNEDILLTLGILPLSGDESVFAASLNGALPGEGADPFYHLFGEYYLDRTIHDTGSVVAPVNPQLGPLMGMGALGTDQYAARPYQPNWFRLSFPEKKKYSLSITTEGEGLYSTRPSGTRGNWGPLPDVIDTSCGAEEYTVLLTNVTPGSSYKFNIAVQNIVPKETCEHCLQGTWEIIPESFDAYMRSIISQVARLNSATVDNIFLTFDDETGLATFTWDNAIVDETKVGLSAENTQGTLVPDMQIVIKVEGTSTSGFDDVEGAIPGQGTITFGPAEGLLDVRIAINGNCQGSEPYNARDLNWTSAEQATYECIEDTLILTPVMPGLRVEPLRFQRMIPVPPPLP